MSPPDRPALGFISEGDEPPVRRKTDVPYAGEPQPIEAAVREHLDVVIELRALREHAERASVDIAQLQQQQDRIETDTHRGLNAATVANANIHAMQVKLAMVDKKVDAIARAVAEMGAGVKQLLERGNNGHG